MSFTKMVDMRRTEQDRAKEAESMYPAMPSGDVADYPYGLCISLSEIELAKLDIDGDCQVGDTIDLRALCKVTSKSDRDVGGKQQLRIELQITQLAVENETTEAPPAGRIASRARRYAG